MKNELMNALANEVTKKLKNRGLDIEKDMTNFLQSQVSEKNKEQVLEQLYLFQLYSNAYLGPDPRAVNTTLTSAILILDSKSDEDVLLKLEQLKDLVELMKNLETNPLSTIKRKLEDEKELKGSRF